MGGWYRTLNVGLWGDAKFRRLSWRAKLLFIYLLTGSHTDGLPGLYAVGVAALAEALDRSVEELRADFEELRSFGMALADWDARVVLLPNAIGHQPPNNPNHLANWLKMLRRIPECALKDAWLEQLTLWAESAGKRYVEVLNADRDTVCHTVTDTVSPPHPHPQPHSHTHKSNVALLRNGDDAPAPEDEIPYTEIVAYLNERAGKRFRHGNETNRRHIKARWREGFRLPDFRAVIDTKCATWLGTDFEQYLRPQTLFASKFESYLNERPAASNPAGSLYPDLDHPQEDPDDS